MVNNEKVKNILSSDVLADEVKQISEQNKNLLYRTKEFGKVENNNLVIERLEKLAKQSLEQEKRIYREYWGENGEKIAASINENEIIKNKNYKYLTAPPPVGVKATSLGSYLTSVFYGYYEDSSNISGKQSFISAIAHLDLESFIKKEIQIPEQQIQKTTENQVKGLFQKIKRLRQKILSDKDSTEEQRNLLLALFSEKNILSYLREGKKSITIDKKTRDQAIRIMVEAGLLQKDRKAMKEYVDTLPDAVEELLTSIIGSFYEEFENEISEKVQNPKEFINFMLNEVISSKQSGQVRGNIVTQANLSFNWDNVLKQGSWKNILKEEKDEQLQNIQGVYSVSEVTSKITDETIRGITEAYIEAFRAYLHGSALDYFYSIEGKLVELVERDASRSLSSQELKSAIENEVQVAMNRQATINAYDRALQELSDLEETLTGNNSNENDIKKTLQKYIDTYELADNKHKFRLEENDIALSITEVTERIIEKRTGLKSNIKGTIGEIFITVLLELVFNNENQIVMQLGTSKNRGSESAHADIAFGEKGKLSAGIQSKVYSRNNIKLYDNTVVHFDTDKAIRYLGSGEELTAFRYFLLNEQVLNQSDNRLDEGFFDSANPFLDVLQMRLDYFIRYNDGLSIENLRDVRNNFYLINFNIVPASVIFLKMLDIITDDKLNSSLLSFEKGRIRVPDNLDDYNINNLLKLLSSTTAHFQSFTLNLSEIGAEIF